MSNDLRATKLQLVADLEAMAADHLPDEDVVVLDHEPIAVDDGRVTITVSAADMRPDALVYRVVVYAPFVDPADGQGRQEDVVSVVSDELPAPWLDPVWQFGWDDRLNTFVAQATVSTPRGLGS